MTVAAFRIYSPDSRGIDTRYASWTARSSCVNRTGDTGLALSLNTDDQRR